MAHGVWRGSHTSTFTGLRTGLLVTVTGMITLDITLSRIYKTSNNT